MSISKIFQQAIPYVAPNSLKALDTLTQNKATGPQFRKALEKGGMKPIEIDSTTGLNDLLNREDSFPKDDLIDVILNNRLEVLETPIYANAKDTDIELSEFEPVSNKEFLDMVTEDILDFENSIYDKENIFDISLKPNGTADVLNPSGPFSRNELQEKMNAINDELNFSADFVARNRDDDGFVVERPAPRNGPTQQEEIDVIVNNLKEYMETSLDDDFSLLSVVRNLGKLIDEIMPGGYSIKNNQRVEFLLDLDNDIENFKYLEPQTQSSMVNSLNELSAKIPNEEGLINKESPSLVDVDSMFLNMFDDSPMFKNALFRSEIFDSPEEITNLKNSYINSPEIQNTMKEITNSYLKAMIDFRQIGREIKQNTVSNPYYKNLKNLYDWIHEYNEIEPTQIKKDFLDNYNDLDSKNYFYRKNLKDSFNSNNAKTNIGGLSFYRTNLTQSATSNPDNYVNLINSYAILDSYLSNPNVWSSLSYNLKNVYDQKRNLTSILKDIDEPYFFKLAKKTADKYTLQSEPIYKGKFIDNNFSNFNVIKDNRGIHFRVNLNNTPNSLGQKINVNKRNAVSNILRNNYEDLKNDVSQNSSNILDLMFNSNFLKNFSFREAQNLGIEASDYNRLINSYITNLGGTYPQPLSYTKNKETLGLIRKNVDAFYPTYGKPEITDEQVLINLIDNLVPDTFEDYVKVFQDGYNSSVKDNLITTNYEIGQTHPKITYDEGLGDVTDTKTSVYDISGPSFFITGKESPQHTFLSRDENKLTNSFLHRRSDQRIFLDNDNKPIVSTHLNELQSDWSRSLRGRYSSSGEMLSDLSRPEIVEAQETSSFILENYADYWSSLGNFLNALDSVDFKRANQPQPYFHSEDNPFKILGAKGYPNHGLDYGISLGTRVSQVGNINDIDVFPTADVNEAGNIDTNIFTISNFKTFVDEINEELDLAIPTDNLQHAYFQEFISALNPKVAKDKDIPLFFDEVSTINDLISLGRISEEVPEDAEHFFKIRFGTPLEALLTLNQPLGLKRELDVGTKEAKINLLYDIKNLKDHHANNAIITRNDDIHNEDLFTTSNRMLIDIYSIYNIDNKTIKELIESRYKPFKNLNEILNVKDFDFKPSTVEGDLLYSTYKPDVENYIVSLLTQSDSRHFKNIINNKITEQSSSANINSLNQIAADFFDVPVTIVDDLQNANQKLFEFVDRLPFKNLNTVGKVIDSASPSSEGMTKNLLQKYAAKAPFVENETSWKQFGIKAHLADAIANDSDVITLTPGLAQRNTQSRIFRDTILIDNNIDKLYTEYFKGPFTAERFKEIFINEKISQLDLKENLPRDVRGIFRSKKNKFLNDIFPVEDKNLKEYIGEDFRPYASDESVFKLNGQIMEYDVVLPAEINKLFKKLYKAIGEPYNGPEIIDGVTPSLKRLKDFVTKARTKTLKSDDFIIIDDLLPYRRLRSTNDESVELEDFIDRTLRFAKDNKLAPFLLQDKLPMLSFKISPKLKEYIKNEPYVKDLLQFAEGGLVKEGEVYTTSKSSRIHELAQLILNSSPNKQLTRFAAIRIATELVSKLGEDLAIDYAVRSILSDTTLDDTASDVLDRESLIAYNLLKQGEALRGNRIVGETPTNWLTNYGSGSIEKSFLPTKAEEMLDATL